ncbi:hypothetical protein HF086_002708 [Spodoptera exigua]|uniref:Phorbol-ester/DAG-type domain-containing protein n=1 Tax=Spodoptera exigua TaxID=7107 RepID=A0A922MA63_SPOEX|nr:hypothetical protein HF086_002708 [Spodoptera exigua]
MDAENEYEIKKVRDAIQTIETIQSMIDVSAERLEGLRTQCSTSAELTQQEIRTLEGKLVKHFSRQLVIKASFGEELRRKLGDVPRLAQWLRVVGLSPDSITAVCSRVASLETLRERSDHEMRALLAGARDEEVLRLCRAMQRLRTYIEALGRGDAGAELQLFWDSWERTVRASPRAPRARHANADHHGTPHNKKGGKSPPTPVAKRKQPSTLPPPAALTKSRSHESQLSVRPDASDLSDNSQSSAVGTSEVTPPASPHDTESDHTPLHRPLPYHNNNTGVGVAPRSPRTPTVSRCMAHDIAHRFTKTMLIATCDYCDKQMFGSGLKCKECKFKCHRDCESKVPPSCGLPPEFVDVFKEKFHKDGEFHSKDSKFLLKGNFPICRLQMASPPIYTSTIVDTTSKCQADPENIGHGSVQNICFVPQQGCSNVSFSLARNKDGEYERESTSVQSSPTSECSDEESKKMNNYAVTVYLHITCALYDKFFTSQGGPDSSSNTSSCNSSTPSSPALAPPLTPHHPHHHQHHPHHTHHPHHPHHPPTTKQQFHFPVVSSPNHVSVQSPSRQQDNKEDLTTSVQSGHSNAMLVVPVVGAARLPPPADDAAEAPPQAPGAVPVASGTSLALRRLRVLRAARGTLRAALALRLEPRSMASVVPLFLM